ncbi:outer membrane protein assembly factor BamE [Pseudomonas sp. PDNC002]|uniref:outer membrane protein assembly factor BamE domain-containing protein n=1 Tax=Pseudomonas sp. PDNC002 TaxID=2811422 RepID=UPI0019622DE6|nr:outer membrane protein assembly factor BamE [Pseudomonas sp. PDNC002]QRY82113.1 outer membrane protein assembly factor BamE [Pseudomonas sp. PDNC002]
MRLPILLSSLMTLVPTSEGATVFRCTAADGSVLFSQHGCPVDEQQEVTAPSNPTPGSGKPVPMATAPASASHRNARAQEATTQTDTLVVVGEQQNGCGNRVTGADRRKAIIEGRIRTGMTRADVESALGRPDTISQNNETLRYHYLADKKHGARSVTFDEDGCVAGKTKR